jgi:hypothetical protein
VHSKINSLSSTEHVVWSAVFLLSALASVSAQTPPVHATIDASKTGAPIAKYIYGQFLEHGGNIHRHLNPFAIPAPPFSPNDAHVAALRQILEEEMRRLPEQLRK